MGFNKLSYIIIAILVFSSGCVTQKKKGDVSKLGKLYHNTTAHYNGYFNANELYEASILQLETQFQDNYNEILPIFPYQEAADPSIVSQDLDNAILKVSSVVTYHRPSEWTDDCYLLMSKCQYAKQDYESAEKTLEFMTDEFDPANRKKSGKSVKKKKKKTPPKKKKISKKKKKKNRKKAAKKRKKAARKKNSTPNDKNKEVDTTLSPQADKIEEEKKTKEDNEAYYDGMLWLAKTYSIREQFDNAYYILKNLESEGGYGKETAKYLPLGIADYYIQLKQYKSATTYLKQAIERADDKYDKARYSFIAGQLLQHEGNYSDASIMFEKCASLHPYYEMEFMARLNSIKNKWRQSGAGLDQLESDLLKMLTESKNEVYKDMIYFTLGDVALDKKDYKNAIKYFKQCLGAKGKNIHQKVESYYQIADISYQLENYQQAHIYYDSTKNVMPNTDPRLELVSKRADNLKPIAQNLKIIEDRDSLLHIATLSEKEQEEWAQKVFEKRKEQEKALNKSVSAVNEPKSSTRRVNINASASNSGGAGSSSFFAYSDKAIKRGEKEFAKIWGSRPLTDDWRRESAISSFDYGDYDDDAFSNVATEEEIQDILKLLPDNQAKKDVSFAAIENALFILGGLYSTNLDAYEKSISALDELLSRFPETNNKLDAYYLLFISHQQLGNISKANQFKQKIIEEFPGSEYAKFLSDPDYFKKQKSAEESLANFYEQLYVTFSSGDFERFDQDLTKGEEKFKSFGEFEARIRLLEAMTAGKSGSKEEYVAALKDFIIKHPNSPEEVRAKEMLRFMGEEVEDKNTSSGKNVNSQKNGPNFKVEKDAVHFMVAEFDGLNSGELNEVKEQIQTFNDKYFQLKRLKLANIYIDYKTKKPVILVRKFLNKKDAMNYYNVVTKNIDEFVTKEREVKYYVVTQNNYRQILLVRNLESYEDFFQEEYLDK
jgi:tetratricopeptide (TPR) repeat protein